MLLPRELLVLSYLKGLWKIVVFLRRADPPVASISLLVAECWGLIVLRQSDVLKERLHGLFAVACAGKLVCPLRWELFADGGDSLYNTTHVPLFYVHLDGGGGYGSGYGMGGGGGCQ